MPSRVMVGIVAAIVLGIVGCGGIPTTLWTTTREPSVLPGGRQVRCSCVTALTDNLPSPSPEIVALHSEGTGL